MSTTPSSEQVDEWFEGMVERLKLGEPVHSYGDTPLTHVLNVARRNGTPHQPKHCACTNCVNGFTHVADVIV